MTVRLEPPRDARTVKVSEKPSDALRTMPAEGGDVAIGSVTVTTYDGSDDTIATVIGIVCAGDKGEAVTITIGTGRMTDAKMATTLENTMLESVEKRLRRAMQTIEARYDRVNHATLTRNVDMAQAEHAAWLKRRDDERALISKARYDAYVAYENASPAEGRRAAAKAAEATRKETATAAEAPPNGTQERLQRVREIQAHVRQALYLTRSARTVGARIPRPSVNLTDGIRQEVSELMTKRMATAKSIARLDREIEESLEACQP